MIRKATQAKLGRLFVKMVHDPKTREIIEQTIQPRRHKYGAKATTVDSIRFASKKEAKRYAELKLLAKAGEISGLELQPKFGFWLNGRKIFSYIGDFSYWIGDKQIIEDVKGVRTPFYKLKKSLIEARYGIEIKEI